MKKEMLQNLIRIMEEKMMEGDGDEEVSLESSMDEAKDEEVEDEMEDECEDCKSMSMEELFPEVPSLKEDPESTLISILGKMKKKEMKPQLIKEEVEVIVPKKSFKKKHNNPFME